MPTTATRLDTSSPNFMRIGGALFYGGRGFTERPCAYRQAGDGASLCGPCTVTSSWPRRASSGLQYKGTPRHMCVYTGRGADKHASYVLKVGEASRDQLDALLALEWQLPCCVVRVAF